MKTEEPEVRVIRVPMDFAKKLRVLSLYDREAIGDVLVRLAGSAVDAAFDALPRDVRKLARVGEAKR